MKPIYVGVNREEKYPLEKKLLIFVEGLGLGIMITAAVALSLNFIF